MSVVHLMCGLPCSGKTTFARTLSAQSGAVRLSLDEVLLTIHGRYSIEEVGHPAHIERVISARLLLWKIATSILGNGYDVVLDDGFFLRETRSRYRDLCAQIHAEARLYYLDAPRSTIERRLELRNSEAPRDNFIISRELIARMYELFEVPGADEDALVVVEGEPELPANEGRELV